MRQRDHKKQTSKQANKQTDGQRSTQYTAEQREGVADGGTEGRREAIALIVPDYIILVRYSIFICMMDVGIYFALL